MSAAQIGYLFGVFLISLFVGLVAIVLGRAFKVRLKKRYVLGATLAILISFVGGANALSVLGALLAVAALYGWLISERILFTKRG